MITALASIGKKLIKMLATAGSDNNKKHSYFWLLVGSIVIGLLLLLLAPISVLLSFEDIESPANTYSFNENEFMDNLSEDKRQQITNMEAAGKAIADRMKAKGLQEQIIKAQLIYYSFFVEHPLTDFTEYIDMFSEDDNVQLIDKICSTYGVNINYNDFMRTYTLVMNKTINQYMFKDSSSKNSADLAAWARNAYVAGWGYMINTHGETDPKCEYRTCDNTGLIAGYLKYDPDSKSFIISVDMLNYAEKGTLENMPDEEGIGLNNGSEFGIYIGSGLVIIASETAGCVIKQAISDGTWTSWGTFDGISYPETIQPVTESTS